MCVCVCVCAVWSLREEEEEEEGQQQQQQAGAEKKGWITRQGVVNVPEHTRSTSPGSKHYRHETHTSQTSFPPNFPDFSRG